MKPPICELCGRDFRHRTDSGRLIRFSDARQLPEGMTGHPRGVGWFCADHKRLAAKLADRPMGEALARMRRRLGWRFGVWLRRRLGS